MPRITHKVGEVAIATIISIQAIIATISEPVFLTALQVAKIASKIASGTKTIAKIPTKFEFYATTITFLSFIFCKILPKYHNNTHILLALRYTS